MDIEASLILGELSVASALLGKPVWRRWVSGRVALQCMQTSDRMRTYFFAAERLRVRGSGLGRRFCRRLANPPINTGTVARERQPTLSTHRHLSEWFPIEKGRSGCASDAGLRDLVQDLAIGAEPAHRIAIRDQVSEKDI